MASEDGKAVFTGLACIYVKGNVWKKSTTLSRISVYDIPTSSPPYRLVVTSAPDNRIQINCSVTPQLAPKRSRDDFITLTIRYGSGHAVSYGIQMKARKFADQLLLALNNVNKETKRKGSTKFEISAPSGFKQVAHTGSDSVSSGGTIGGPPQSPRALPPGWLEARAPDGRPYYYNANGETTWNRPGAGPPGGASATPSNNSLGSSSSNNNNNHNNNSNNASGYGQGVVQDPASTAKAQQLLQSIPGNVMRVDKSQVRVAAAIGKGCYGTVYEGQWNGRAVAVKSLDVAAQKGDVDTSLREFRVETMIMTQISDHPNVLGILAVLVDLPQLSIIMEFMELTDLYAVLTSGENISQSMEDMWVKGIADGLRHVARCGIIHRDVAARNVLLNRDYRPKIADFGLAIAVADNCKMEETALNKWLAPEAIRDRVYTLKSDVWSYGVTVWEIVTKSIPYPGMDPMMAAMRIVGEDLTPISDKLPDNCSPLHAQVMRACFIVDQEQRASMEDVGRILALP